MFENTPTASCVISQRKKQKKKAADEANIVLKYLLLDMKYPRSVY
jgi:hypothetical protein